MSTHFGALADECFVSNRLFLKLELPLVRDTVLHFFEQVRKAFPEMRRMHRREDGCLILEEQSSLDRSRRWTRLDATSLRFGHFAPRLDDDLRRLGEVILDQAPYHLSFSDLDFDHLDLVYGFDLEYRGNHDQLIADVIWADHPLADFLTCSAAQSIIDTQPYLGIGLTPECDLQAYVEVKSRTSTYEVRTGEYDTAPLSVLLTIRKYWGIEGNPVRPLLDTYRDMHDRAEQLARERIVPLLVNPLAQAIASRS